MKQLFLLGVLVTPCLLLAQNTSLPKDSVRTLTPLEIVGVRAADKQPFTKTNISKAQIEQLNTGQDIPFVLNQTPGVVAHSDAGNGIGYTGLRIRGTDATRINVTLNGIPYNDAESQGTFLVNIPDILSSTNSIQIQRGVGTSTNGAGAFGASLNVSTHEIADKPYAEFNNSFGSFNSWKNTVKLGSGLIDGKFSVDARLSRITSDGFMERATSNLQAFYLSAAYYAKKTTFRYTTFSGRNRTYQAWSGVPEAMLATNRRFNGLGLQSNGEFYPNQTDNYQQHHHQFFITHNFNQKWSINLANYLTLGKGYYEEFRINNRYSSYNLPNPSATVTRTDLTRQLWLDNQFFGQNITVQYKHKATELTFGGGWNQYNGLHYGYVLWAANGGVPINHRWYNLDAFKADRNLYAKWLYSLKPNLQLFVDLQVRNVQYEMNGFRNNPSLFINRNFTFFNPKAGVSYQKNGVNYYASVAVANKEPNRDDFEVSSTEQPQHENLLNVELGAEKKTKKYSYAATIYGMWYRNQLILTGRVNDVGAYTRVNVPRSYRIGIELQGSYVFTKWLQAQGNIALSDNRINAFTEFLDNFDTPVFTQEKVAHRNTAIALSPSCVANANLQFTVLPQFTVSTNAQYVSRQFLDNTSNKARSLQAYWVQDIRLAYTVPQKFCKKLQLLGSIQNIWNRRFEPNGYTFSYVAGGSVVTENFFFPMAGTNAMLAVNISL